MDSRLHVLIIGGKNRIFYALRFSMQYCCCYFDVLTKKQQLILWLSVANTNSYILSSVIAAL
jgi:hypothetical protein